MPPIKLLVQPLLALAPELQKDIAKYCRGRAKYLKELNAQVEGRVLNNELSSEKPDFVKVLVAQYVADHLEGLAKV